MTHMSTDYNYDGDEEEELDEFHRLDLAGWRARQRVWQQQRRTTNSFAELQAQMDAAERVVWQEFWTEREARQIREGLLVTGPSRFREIDAAIAAWQTIRLVYDYGQPDSWTEGS